MDYAEVQSVANPGLYLRALCDGMDEALEEFRNDVKDLENTVIHDAHTPLSLILCRIEKYVCVFAILNSIIREVGMTVILFCISYQFLF